MYLEDGTESSDLYVNSKNTSVGFAHEGSVAPQLIFSYGVILLFDSPNITIIYSRINLTNVVVGSNM